MNLNRRMAKAIRLTSICGLFKRGTRQLSTKLSVSVCFCKSRETNAEVQPEMPMMIVSDFRITA